jgi:AraC-like DNA-binding protein
MRCRIAYIVCASMMLNMNVLAEKHDDAIALIPYSRSKIGIDGMLKDWKKFAKFSFADTLQELRPAPGRSLMPMDMDFFDYSTTWKPRSKNRVEVWICWDLDNLYFAFQVDDAHLFADIEPEGETPAIHLNDGIEIYFDTKADSERVMDVNDYQVLIDISGNHLVFRGSRELTKDNLLLTPKATGQNVLLDYAVHIPESETGSTNASGYVIEIAIPFAAIGLKAQTGHTMSMDIACNDIDYPINNTYTKEELALRYWAFNWSGISDLGYPETWQKVQLAGMPNWFDKMTGADMRTWFSIYITVLFVTFFILSLLYNRMRKLERLPARPEIPVPKIIFIEGDKQDQRPLLTENERFLSKAAEYVTKNTIENIRSEKLASAIGLTLRTLQRITREELNTTPTNFIYLIKLNQAAEYLKSGKGNISQTAYEFGFTDPGYFSKLFKRHFGVSPAEYIELNT